MEVHFKDQHCFVAKQDSCLPRQGWPWRHPWKAALFNSVSFQRCSVTCHFLKFRHCLTGESTCYLLTIVGQGDGSKRANWCSWFCAGPGPDVSGTTSRAACVRGVSVTTQSHIEPWCPSVVTEDLSSSPPGKPSLCGKVFSDTTSFTLVGSLLRPKCTLETWECQTLSC